MMQGFTAKTLCWPTEPVDQGKLRNPIILACVCAAFTVCIMQTLIQLKQASPALGGMQWEQ